MTKAEQMFETAKKLMELQGQFLSECRDVQHDQTIERAEAHMLVDAAVKLCSSMFEVMAGENKQYLEELVEKGSYSYKDQYIAGVTIEGRSYATKEVKGFELLNKEDPKVWAHVLAAAAKNNPEVIQKRITDSKVTEQFLKDCDGFVAVKATGAYNWSVTKTK